MQLNLTAGSLFVQLNHASLKYVAGPKWDFHMERRGGLTKHTLVTCLNWKNGLSLLKVVCVLLVQTFPPPCFESAVQVL